MNTKEDDSLTLACERVSVLDVARDLGLEVKLGANRSPFREDRKPSFSVSKEGHFFQDFASGDRGGCWKFTQLAKPDWSKGEVASYLINLAGIEVADKKPWRPDVKKLAEERRRKRVAAFDAEQRRWEVVPVVDTPELAGSDLEERFREGCEYLMDTEDSLVKLAKWRGWPVRWVEALVECNKLSLPVEPWENGKRRAAFLVERLKAPGTDELVSCGYHQRYYSWSRRASEWRFRPSESMNGVSCHPYPFVIGDVVDPEVLVIHEGQWDAITWWGAAGFFEDGEAPLGDHVACMGLRGANSVDKFVSFWGDWIGRHRPRVWLFNDADEAGEGFFRSAVDKDGRLYPSLTDRLYRLGCPLVVNSSFDAPGIKDFNDAYKVAPASWGPSQLYELMELNGLLG